MKQLFKTILCPIELESQSMLALKVARALAEQNSAKVCLVHVVTPPLPRPLEPVPEWEKRVNGKLGKIATDHFADKVRCDFAILRGEPAAAIIRAAQDMEADLIVMATHGHTGLNRVLLGSVAERVVRESPVPVLTVRPDRVPKQF